MKLYFASDNTTVYLMRTQYSEISCEVYQISFTGKLKVL